MSLLLAIAGAEIVHAAQPHSRKRRRLKWREFENLPEDQPQDEPQPETAKLVDTNTLQDATDVALVAESRRLAALLAAAKTEEANAKARAERAQLAQEIAAARVAMAQAIEAAMLAERLAQEIEEIDVAYITATLLND